MASLDGEVKAMDVIVEALDELADFEVARVLAYINNRYGYTGGVK